MARRPLVIIGNGMVGQRFVDEFVRAGGCEVWDVTVIGEEPVAAYDRVALSSVFDGATTADLNLCDVAGLQDAGVAFRFGQRVESINRSAHTVLVDSGDELPYEHLVIATGSAPFVPPVVGSDLPGCFVYRTLDDLELIGSWAKGRSKGVVIGGGLLGLEAANALDHLGLETHVVEMADRLMPQQLDPAASSMLGRWIDELGVTCHFDFATAEIEGSSDGVTGLRQDSGDVLDCELVVFSAGIRPRHQLAENAGLEIGQRGGIVVDDSLSTSDPAISAIGEVACHRDMLYGLVGPGYRMAEALVGRLSGNSLREFTGASLSTKLKLFGVEMASFGTGTEADDAVVYSDPLSKIHRRLSLRDGVVVGGVLVGDVSGYSAFDAMADGLMESPANVAQLVLPEGLGGPVELEIPDSAQICSCNNVTYGDVRGAVGAGCREIASLKTGTAVGTGCGGCLPSVAKLLNENLELLGVEVSTALCEHFAYTRQELFGLIHVHGHSTWAEVLNAHGYGRGCDICRPTVGSILASMSTGYVLDGDQASLQDTNDHALANMQNNGTYSVIPRVPGGEITPEQLIALGEIARDFDLYTKITGGQRIDLLGAQLHQLPLIWERVIEAGLESGHAYGKALRTVKSCVGSTWCRYGVQDSVAMAIRLELRYRGLRSPHKLKSAVSGCARECAEAMSKDFGIIATEAGWNLYLGGNGGRVPRHGELFAVDLSDDDLIAYLDRYLMFYIRTADRLERTSTWIEGLDGGIDYLRSVIIDDSLGLSEELEADMARHVATYECEWSATLKQPDRLEHFVEFVNAPDVNSTPIWIRERGQNVPA